MVDGQVKGMLPTILASVIIPSQHLAFGQLDLRVWAMDHIIKPDDGRARINSRHGFDLAATIQNQTGFSSDNEGYGAAHIADV